jgi:hypothetical protein
MITTLLAGLMMAVLPYAPAPDFSSVWAAVMPGGRGMVAKATYGDLYYRFAVVHRMWPMSDRLQLVVNEEPPPWTLPPGVRAHHMWVETQETVSCEWDGVGQHLVLAGNGVGPGPTDGPREYVATYDVTYHPQTGRFTGSNRIDSYPPTPVELAPVTPGRSATSRPLTSG